MAAKSIYEKYEPLWNSVVAEIAYDYHTETVINPGMLSVGDIVVLETGQWNLTRDYPGEGVKKGRYQDGLWVETEVEPVSARDWLVSQNRQHVLMIVHKVTAASARLIRLDAWHSSGLMLDQAEAALDGTSDRWSDQIRWSSTRAIVRVSDIEALRAASTGKTYKAYAKVGLACQKAYAKVQAEMDAQYEAQEQAAEAAEQIAKTLNAALGVDLVDYSGDGLETVQYSLSWTNDVLDVAFVLPRLLAGRLALGEITQAEHDEAVSLWAEHGPKV